MQHHLKRGVVVVTMALAFAITAIGAEEKKKEDAPQVVALTDLPAPARAAVEKWLAGGAIKKIEKEDQDGKIVYDVEATVNGEAAEADIAADGTVLTTEKHVAYDSLPKTIRDAAEKYFGSAKGLNASKEIEKGKASYEVEGKKDSQKVTLKFDEAGKIVEEEKE